MPDKLSKKKTSRNSTTTYFEDVDDFGERDDRVTYLSTNKKTGTEFVGSAPPNSRLAATLAQVAAAVQADNLPKYKNGPARITSGASPRGLIQEAPAPAPATYRDEREYYPNRGYATEYRDGREDYEQTQGSGDARDQNYARSQERTAYQPPLAPQQRPADIYSAGTRHELDRKVAYHAKGPNGELYVSAPTGSNEAQLFDELARKMSKSNVSAKI
jgi:hypothetical protein